MKNEALFRDKPVWSAIFSLAIPACITILIMTVYNMADMFFIGMLGDTAQVAAVSIVSPMFSLVMAAATMLGVGGCSVIASAIGAGKTEEAKTFSSLCCMSAVLFGILCATVMLSATIVSVLRQGGILIPSLYLMERLMGFIGIAAAHAVADVLSTVIAVAVCLWQYRVMKKKILAMNEKPNPPAMLG